MTTSRNGEVTESDRELIKQFTNARNYSDIAQQVVVDLKVDESTNWSKTNSYGFSESVSTENTFKWPLVGDTKLNIKFEANCSQKRMAALQVRR
ncbi:aerolysin family beta-barrel pore-forming toxin [Vibrio chagasii]|nr:aerolysin family beta-barrel pore-forming toxin [Vibrio chagasii]